MIEAKDRTKIVSALYKALAMQRKSNIEIEMRMKDGEKKRKNIEKTGWMA